VANNGQQLINDAEDIPTKRNFVGFNKRENGNLRRPLLFYAILYWISAIIFITSQFALSSDVSHINLVQIMLKVAFFFVPLQLKNSILLNYTLAFVKLVQSYIKSLSSTIQNDLSVTHVYVDARITNDKDRNIQNTPIITTIPAQASSYNSFNRRIPLGHKNTNSSFLHILDQSPRNQVSEYSTIELENMNSHSQISQLQIPESPLVTSPPPLMLFTVINTFNVLSRPDEIMLNSGDLVQVDVIFQDGWGFGTNRATDKQGYFPMTSFAPPIDPGSQNISNNVMKVPINHGSPMVGSQRTGSLLKLESTLEIPGVPMMALSDSQGTVVAGVSTSSNADLLVVLPVRATRDDELNLAPGDRVLLEQAYNDGWGFGTSADRTGYFPLSSCIVMSEKK
ncbi:hypothetical protein HK096_002117, partial [Nowakowskiella sp. JEL0078]